MVRHVMPEDYDDPQNPNLRNKFHQVGKVVFLLSKRETSLLRNLIMDELKLGTVVRREGWKSHVVAKHLVFTGILKTAYIFIFFHKLMNVFAFYAIDKEFIRNIDQNTLPNGLVELTFHKKSS